MQTEPTLLATGILIALLGLSVGGGGVWLISLGGSWYDLAAAPGLLLTGILLAMAHPAALWVDALIVAGTLG